MTFVNFFNNFKLTEDGASFLQNGYVYISGRDRNLQPTLVVNLGADEITEEFTNHKLWL